LTLSVLVATLSHFLELGPELESLGYGRNVDLMEDQADAFWAQAHPALDTLALYVLLSIAHASPDGTGVE
jgi:hypothetical protein